MNFEVGKYYLVEDSVIFRVAKIYASEKEVNIYFWDVVDNTEGRRNLTVRALSGSIPIPKEVADIMVNP